MLRKVVKEQLKVPAHVDYLGDLRDFVTQVGKKYGFPVKVINAFKLSVDEAATNIIRHAYRDKEGHITIRAIVKKSSLTISIIDQGTYFDPQRVKAPDLNRYIDIGKKGGLGIFIMRKLMDDIDYRRTEEGNELRITKKRDAPVKKKRFVGAVSSIPLSIKAKFFFRTILVITFIIAGGYLYYYLKADDIIVSEFISSARTINNQIVNRLNSNPPAAFESFLERDIIVRDIFENYKEQIYQISVEDSTGRIVNSNNLDEVDKIFNRPHNHQQISEGVYQYDLSNDSTYFEIEDRIVIKQTKQVFGKSHIYISAESTEKQIVENRLNDLKLAFIVMGMSWVGVAILIYLVMNPLHKLSEWIKDLGHGEIDDEIDIDASSEIGEIAQAFSDITQKFRASQKSLVDQERLQKEMQVAHDIQQTLLPMEFPDLEGYEIASYYEAAKDVGGDYYDFVEVDKDTLGIAVADVSGKGVPGALVMSMIRQTLRTEARGVKDAAEVLSRVNSFISGDIRKGMFVTVFYLIIDSKKRCINYASAGHNPMILYRGNTKQTYYLNPKGFPIGIQLPEKDLFRKSIDSETIQLTKDDILLVYTDGITEAMNSNRELLGEERLLDLLRRHGHLDVNEFVEQLKLGIHSFTEGNPQYDDISLVAIKEKSTREEDELRRAKEAHKMILEGSSIREACETVNLTTYAYYSKYKKVFEEEGMDSFEINEDVSVEAKHLSVEEKTKIFDIIAKHPEYGASRISDELKTERYNFTEISESKIYDELVRSRLNTRQLREAYISKIKKSNRKLKPPGTPMMTLDGKIIIDHKEPIDFTISTEPRTRITTQKRSKDQSEDEKKLTDGGVETAGEESVVDDASHIQIDEDSDLRFDVPIDEILAKEHAVETDDDFSESDVEGEEIKSEVPPHSQIEAISSIEDHASVTELNEDADISESGTFEKDESAVDYFENQSLESSLTDEFSFEELFGGQSNLEDQDFDDDEDEQPIVISTNSDEETQTVELPDPFRPKDEPSQPDDSQSAVEDEKKEKAQYSELGSKEGEDDLTIPSIDELLAEESSDSNNKEDTVSFSDLIQSIDEEIVYVSDKKEKNDFKSGNSNGVENRESGSHSEHHERDGLVSKFKRKRKKKLEAAGAPGMREARYPDASEKEKILIPGIKYYKEKDYEKAIDEFKKIVEIYPDYKEAHSILGNAYFRNQMYEDAAESYKLVKRIDPADIAAYENLGVIYANRGDYKLAIREWEKVLELNPERVDVKEKIERALQMI
ncbi:MAG: SpoIIE family protein phosphatase [bacterium]